MRDKEGHFIYSLNMKEERAKNSQDTVLKKKNKETVWENMLNIISNQIDKN